MGRELTSYILLSSLSLVLTKEPELPPCPTNVQYLPQNLPMHCRMTAAHQAPPVPLGPPYYPTPISGKPSENTQIVPVPPLGYGKPPGFPPGFPPGAPPGFPMGAPPGFPVGAPPGFPLGAPGLPPGVAMPPGVPMPMPGAPPSAKLPVIVMPFYSPDPTYKGPTSNLRPERPRRPRRDRFLPPRRYRDRHSDTSTEDDTDSSSAGLTSRESSGTDRGSWWKGRRAMTRRSKKQKHHKQRVDLLTPILQYVTKDGYVIYEKKISKGEAKDWIGTAKQNNERMNEDDNEQPPPPQPEAAKDKSEEEEDEVATSQAPQTTPKIHLKIQKNTNIKRHHHHKPNLLVNKIDNKQK